MDQASNWAQMALPNGKIGSHLTAAAYEMEPKPHRLRTQRHLEEGDVMPHRCRKSNAQRHEANAGNAAWRRWVCDRGMYQQD